MPTFIFYRNRTKLGFCQGADPAGLESKIQQYYGNGDTEDSEGSVTGHVRNNNNNIYYHIFGMILVTSIYLYWTKYRQYE